MEPSKLVEHLCRLPIEELAAVLRAVFETRTPFPEEATFHRNRFFLGIASSMLESDEPERWEPWEVQAIASPGPEYWPDHAGPDWGFCQYGECQVCGFGARSNVKNGLCGICGSSVYMT